MTQSVKHKVDLFRVTSLARLKELIEFQGFTLVTYRQWKTDPAEALLVRALHTAKGEREVFEILKRRGTPHDIAILKYQAMTVAGTTFMQSWTIAQDNMAIWSEYAKGNEGEALQLRFPASLHSNIPSIMRAELIDYTEENSLEKEIDWAAQPQPVGSGANLIWSSAPSSFNPTLDLTRTFTRKLQAWSHEREVRLMTPVEFMKSEHPTGTPDLLLMPFQNGLRGVISGIMLGPKASESTEIQVREICERENVAFEGRSSILSQIY